MKRVRILLAMLTAVVLATSCATTQNTAGSDYDETTTRRVGDRVYVNDPYYGTVVLERDPFTGRYYDVTYGYSRFCSPYNTRNYRNGYGSYNTYPRAYRGSGQRQQPAPRVTEESRKEARGKILGN